MQELTDDQLDGLFRKSAEEFEPPYDPVAWQAMQGLLDTHNQTAPRPKPVLWKKIVGLSLVTLLLLLLTGGGWLAYRQQQLSETKVIGQKAADSSTEASAGQTALTRSTATKPVASVDPNRVKIAEDTKPKPTDDLVAANSAKPNQPTDGLTSNDINSTNERATSARKSTAVPERLNKVARIPLSHEAFNKDSIRSGFNPTSNESHTHTISKVAPGKAEPDAYVRSTKPEVGARTVNTSTRTRTISKRTTNLTAPAELSTTRISRKNTRANLQSLDLGQTRSAAARYSTRRNPGVPSDPHTPGQTPSFNSRQMPNQSGQVSDKVMINPDNTMATQPELSNLPTITELTNRPGQWPKPLPFVGRQLEQLPIDEPTKKAPVVNQSSQKGFSVRLIVSPDLSTIGLKNFQRPGTNYGAMLEYRVAPRWSVQLGAMQTVKVYKAVASDYDLTPYTAKWPLQPESVNGQCKMIDIPINFRYDVALRPGSNGKPVSRWFVTGGLTSYLIWNEDYTYNYVNPNSPHIYEYMKGWHGRSGWNGFSQLNMSVGYERAINQRLFWQVEPFIKAPLKGVGYFNVDLLSTGAFFSLRYKL